MLVVLLGHVHQPVLIYFFYFNPKISHIHLGCFPFLVPSTFSPFLCVSSSLTLSVSYTHVPIIYGCWVLDQLIAGNPLVNRVLDTLPIDLGY